MNTIITMVKARFMNKAHDASTSVPTAKERLNEIDKLQRLWRRKSEMVLYELEITLGDFVCNEVRNVADLPDKAVQNIQARETGEGRAFNASTTAGIIAATYLDEVFTLAQSVAKGRPEEKYLASLRKLFDTLNVISIRNAISHPNRPFHPSYWYRIAAIATDPLIDQLQFRNVTNAFWDAEAGKLTSPPEAWINAPIWSLPNNLPQQFDHDITGLIGRKRELEQLMKNMTNQRLNLIAIVAPGGSGKTALLLQALQEIIVSPQATEWVDRVLYFTSKTEVLTLDGIINQTPVGVNIESLKSAIALTLAEQEGLESLSFDDACKKFGCQRILLCLDNLETILRDDPEIFENFYHDLPREWRVVVTSRIRVNSGHSMPLDSLSLDGAKRLAREYLSKRGGERISEEEFDSLIKFCDMNPLAIRLSIDGFILGKKSLQEMQSIAKQQVIDFSYRNLIEALSPIARHLLECLFVSSEPISRIKACSLLQKDLDEIAEGFSQIKDTSLVTRTPGLSEESYTLSSSVRDLLIVQPVDKDARHAIEEEIRKRRQLVSEINRFQQVQDTNPLSIEYIPNSAPDEVKLIASEALKLWKRARYSTSEELIEHLKKIQQAINLYKHSLLHRVLGLILLRLGDRTRGKKELQYAWEMSPCDIAAGSVLSLELRKDQDLDIALTIAEKLIKDGWGNPERSSTYHASLVIQNYIIPLIWLGKTDKVIEDSNKWRDTGTLLGTWGTLRAMALRRSIENERDIEKSQEVLCQAIDVLDEVFSLEGYVGSSVVEGVNLVEQLVYLKKGNQELSEKAKYKFTNFLDKHLVMMCQEHRDYSLENSDVREWVQEMSSLQFKHGKNPLASDRWLSLLKISVKNDVHITKNLEGNWIKVTVYQIPEIYRNGEIRPFLYAQDTNDRKYFIHRNQLDFGYFIWDQLQNGDCLEILPEKYSENGKYPKALRARFLED